MKTILLLTDFSENADHAAQSALMLCSRLHNNLLLFNNLCGATVSEGYVGSQWLQDSLPECEPERYLNLQKTAEFIEQQAVNLKRGQYKPNVSVDCGAGNIGENVENIMQSNDIEFALMGGGVNCTLEQILNDNNTSTVIDYISRPLIIVPQPSTLDKLKKVTFATGFNESDINAIRYICKLGSVFGFQLDIVHVDPLDKKGEIQDEIEANFKKQVTELNYPQITFNAVKGKDVVKRLIRLCEESESELLSVVYYDQSFFIRMLHQSTAKKVLNYQKVPLMILPAKMCN